MQEAPDIGPLIHLINLHGENLVGAEVGVMRGSSLCAILQLCNNIKELHGIYNWLPYNDYIGSQDGNPIYSMPEVECEINKAITEISIKHCEGSERAILHHMDSTECSKMFDDNHFDFVFLDTYLSYDQAVHDLEVWYPKVKKGGLFTGHDYYSPEVNQALTEFRNKHNITSRLSGYAECYAWIKE